MALLAAGILLLFAILAIGAPVLAPYDPLKASVTDRIKPIGTPGYLLGTDEQGRDLLSRLIYGGRLSLLTGLIPVLVATVLGTALGAVAGGGIAGAVQRALSLDPKQRYADCGTFARALLGVGGGPASSVQSATAVKGAGGVAAAPARTMVEKTGISCPGCGKQFKLPAVKQGKQVMCPACGTGFRAPLAAQAST